MFVSFERTLSTHDMDRLQNWMAPFSHLVSKNVLSPVLGYGAGHTLCAYMWGGENGRAFGSKNRVFLPMAKGPHPVEDGLGHEESERQNSTLKPLGTSSLEGDIKICNCCLNV